MEELKSGGTVPCKAETNDYIRTFGKSLRFGKPLTKTTSRKYIGGPQTRAQFEETKEYTDGFCPTTATIC